MSGAWILLSLWVVLALAVESGVAAADSEQSTASTEAAADPSVEGAGLDEEPDPLFDDDFEFEEPPSFPDPGEEVNRGVLKFNQGLDRALLRPLTRFFGWITPDPVLLALRRFFTNANTPAVLVNDILQLEWKDCGVSLGAFLINTTVGIAGFFDPASELGLSRHRSDFGQTLALAEVGSGPYVVLPLLGPSTARDATGGVVDFFLHPLTWVFPAGHLLYFGGEGFVSLEEHHAGLEELERGAVDFYPVLRSAYYQNRMDEIWGRREHRRPKPPVAPVD